MKKLISFLSVCLFIACASPAFAISIKIWKVTDEKTENINNWIGSQDGSAHVLEDFENIDTGWYSDIETGVGAFIADGNIGNVATSHNKDKNDDFSTIHNPEPATMLLFGFGLIGIAGITRKLT